VTESLDSAESRTFPGGKGNPTICRRRDGATDRTCNNWTFNAAGHAEVGGPDRAGGASWNAAATTQGCSEADFTAAGGAGLFYCFAIN
jgi:hypothetical protein